MEQERANRADERRMHASRDLEHDQATDDLLMMREWVAEERDLRLRDILDSLTLEGQLTSEDALINAIGFLETLSVDESRPSPGLLLTEREHDVLKLLITGMSNREIADVLKVTVNTVKTHLVSCYSKLNVHNRTEAAVVAREQNLLQ